MKNLRILEIRNGRFPQGFTYLPNELRLLNWHGFPLESMPTGFQPNNLVQLRMTDSRIKQLWRGVVVRFHLYKCPFSSFLLDLDFI